MASELLALQNISMYYHSATSVVPGITGVTLSFSRGEFVVITGESGSGKSTLLNIISALSPYHDGEMRINGEPTSAYSEEEWEEYRKENISFVFQDYNLIKSYSVLENVMSAVVLRGIEKKEAKRLAILYLKKVGLEKYIHRKSSRLSSGQKQRLAIARALAKDTDIIVADEPTGNLDSENGRQIVELLAQLSKEKLVIMVSHNIDEAMEYATRRIRIHSGHVVADQKLREEASVEKKPVIQEEKHSSNKKTAFCLAALNMKAQPVKTFLVCIFLFICIIASTVFAAGFLASADDTGTRLYNKDAFLNGNNHRLILARQDGSKVTKQDIEKLRELKYIKQVELYDGVADINYYCLEDGDYNRVYTSIFSDGIDPVELRRECTIKVLREDRFIKSISCLTERELQAGRIPQNVNEIVYGTDSSKIGTTIEIAIKDNKNWAAGQYVVYQMTITGVVNDDAHQVYFSEELCRALLANNGTYRRETTTHYSTEGDYTKELKLKEKTDTYLSILMPEQSIQGNDIMISSLRRNKNDILLEHGWQMVCDSKSYNEHSFRQENSKSEVIKLIGMVDNSTQVVMISEEMFEKLFPELLLSQMTLYIEDYAYTDDVLRLIEKQGYYGASPFRIGSLEYDKEKVNEHFITLIICSIAFFMVFGLEILLLRAFLKFKKEDYRVLRSIGMPKEQMKQMIYYEILFDYLVAILLAIVVLVISWQTGNERAYDLMKYLRWYHYMGLLLLDSFAVLILSATYSGYLNRQFGTKAVYETR